ncbi:glycosyl transferase family 4-domain-containing protein [Coemansia mojavensis]|nr:glycosyl transferase family 4-domain-containing protein [Coemansia mojavensis]
MLHNRVTLASSPVLLALLWQFRDEPLAVCTCISLLAGLFTWCLIPASTVLFKRAGLSGRDLSKPARPLLAESMGMVAATLYLVATFVFIPAQFQYWSESPDSRSHVFPFDRLGEYLSALLSLQSMVFLGFADDVFNLRWRFKLLLPSIASIPVLIVYYVGYGVTHVVVPVFMRPWLGSTVDLGMLYYVYIGLMAVFCTNAINILAGINGVEVGQSLVIALSIIVKDVANINSNNPDYEYHHLFSLYLLLPFTAVSLALYYWNVFPARVFVGDTYCYFAGMTFAVCGILGHFSKTLLLLFGPQIFNFIYSTPQIFGLVPCPRHRLPQMKRLSVHGTPYMVPSRTQLEGARPLGLLIIQVYEKLGLVDVERDESGQMTSVNNLTLLNLVLVRSSRLTEAQLNNRILLIQTVNSVLAFIIRYRLSHLFYF